MQAPVCLCSRSNWCSASGRPRKRCRPLSTPPMRRPLPPQRTRPVMSSVAVMGGVVGLCPGGGGAGGGPPAGEGGGAGDGAGGWRGGGGGVWGGGGGGGRPPPADITHLHPPRALHILRATGWQAAAQLGITVRTRLPDGGDGRGD